MVEPMARQKQNYLDFIPCRNPSFSWEKGEDGMVTVTVVHTGFFDRIAQFLGRPKQSRIALDRYGSFVWEMIDGERSVYAISEAVREQFGEQAEPLLPRLIRYFEILREHQDDEIIVTGNQYEELNQALSKVISTPLIGELESLKSYIEKLA